FRRTLAPRVPGFLRFAVLSFLMGLMFVAFMAAFAAAVNGLFSSAPSDHPPGRLLFNPSMVFMLVPFMMSLQGLHVSGMRALRCLPLTAPALGGRLMAAAVAPSVGLLAVTYVIARIAYPAMVGGLPLSALAVVAVLQPAVSVPLHLRLASVGIPLRMIASMLLWVPSAVLVVAGPAIGIAIAVIAVAAVAAVSFVWTTREIRTGRHAYRGRP